MNDLIRLRHFSLEICSETWGLSKPDTTVAVGSKGLLPDWLLICMGVPEPGYWTAYGRVLTGRYVIPRVSL